MTGIHQLRRVQRDIRLSGAEDFQRMSAGPAGTADFARAVMARYGGPAAGRPGMLERVYRRLAFGVFLTRIYRHELPAAGSAPSLRFTLHFVRKADASGGESADGTGGFVMPVTGETSLGEQLRVILNRRILRESQVEAVAREVITRSRQTEQRIISSMRRVEAGTTPGSASSGGLPQARSSAAHVVPSPPAISRVYARSNIAAEQPAQAGVNIPAADQQAASALARRSVAAAPPAVDVNALTEQVIRAIDQRIIAQRERLGRT